VFHRKHFAILTPPPPPRHTHTTPQLENTVVPWWLRHLSVEQLILNKNNILKDSSFLLLKIFLLEENII
jgi:hypothetical protein